MKITIIYLALLLATPVIAGDAKSSTWTLSTGVEVIKEDFDPVSPVRDPYVSFYKHGTYVYVTINDYLYSREPIKDPWVSLVSDGRATLNYGTDYRNDPYPRKSEYFREIVIRIAEDRIEKGGTLYVYNLDVCRVLGHHKVN